MGRRIDPWLIGIALLSLALNLYRLDWGLPNGNSSWAADAVGPATAIGITRRSFAEWNSGWFYFKYPPAYPFLMTAAGLPYLAYLYATGGWRSPKSTYPYGFADPETALYTLALIGRLLNVAFATGTVLLVYGIGRRLLGVAAARLGAFLVATAYPIIYYAHTTNIDAGYVFWLIFALFCAVVASQSTRFLAWVGLGVGAAMAVSTKEQGFAFLLPLPLILLAERLRAERRMAVLWSRPVLAMAGAALGTVALANNAVYNPLGFAGRVAYLLGRPLEETEARLAPVHFALWKGAKEWVYVREFWDGIESALGLPLVLVAAAGAVAIWRRPRAAVWLLVPVVSQYYLSLRGLDLITLRYLLPVMVVGALVAAGFLIDLRGALRPRVARVALSSAIVLLAGLGLARALDLAWIFRNDSRYAAEAWMGRHLPPNARIEVYQKPAFLPRFRGEVEATFVPPTERTPAGVRERRPDVIVLSSASHKSITHIWTADWRETGDLLAPQPEAVALLGQIEGGELGYELAAVFRQEPRWLRSRITSLCPEIRIYARDSE